MSEGAKLSYTVIIHKAAEGGYWTNVPALPGAGSQGETLDEALEMTKEAIGLMVESLVEDGRPVPDDVEPIEKVCKITVAA